eukprot:TRINITY_DN760_c0_g2_i1.p1 TRINITY_DN760_c0_g2~~TRINITY_DN760_c0_g2_i1.p1  ORF type:complete len:748 (-),score=245.96 TRINITY_DN760_c0_g2_i1:140-2278(-)
MVIAFLLLNAVSAAVISSSSFTASFAFDEHDASSKGNAVRKVVLLLQQMSSKIEEEQAADQAIYDKTSCWCTTNINDKTSAISSGNARVKYLTGHAETLSSNIGTWLAESLNLKKDIEKGKEAIDQANALRNKQKAEFQAIEKDVLETINQLVEAEATIQASITEDTAKPGEAALLQKNLAKTQATLTKLQKEVARTAGRIALSDHNSNTDDFLKTPFFRANGASFLQRAGEPSADDALGVVNGVKGDYLYNLGDLRTKETANFQSYRALVTAKEAELKANKKQLVSKTQAVAKAEQQKADEQQEIEETKQTVADDTVFLKSVQEKCRLVDKAWDERQKTRADEQEAISKTIEVLDGDEARASFTSALSHSFIQVSSVSNKEKRAREAASAVLAQVGARLDARLVALSMRTKLDGFDRVKTAIQEMVDALKLEQSNEVKQRDYCVDSFNQNELETQDKSQTKDALTAKMEELSATMKTAKDEADALQSEVAEMQKQIKLAEQNREAENKEFQPVIKEQRVVQEILAKASKVLKGYYTIPEASLIQVKKHQVGKSVSKHHAGQPVEDNLLTKPEDFKEYKQQSGGYAVVELIGRLINDSKKAEAEAAEAERQSQKSYEELVKDATATITSKKQAIVELLEQRSLDEEDLMEATSSHHYTTNELSQLSATNKQLHEQCDWVLKNFEVTQKARLEEMESLRQAQGILSGDTETGK